MFERKNRVFLLITAVLIMISLVACGQSGPAPVASTTQTTTGASESTTATTLLEQQSGEQNDELSYIELTYYCDYNFLGPIASVEENQYVDWILEKFNTKIIMDNPGAASYKDRLSVVMASGQPHDVIQAFNNPISTYKKFVKDDLLLDLTPFINDRVNYPNILGGIRPEAWAQITELDGSIYSIPSARYDVPNPCNYVRKDWVEKLNIEPPVTLEDWRVMFERFVNEDPDGNGLDDTFGLIPDYVGLGWPIIRIPFECDSYKIIDNKIIPPAIQDEYRQYLIYAADMVKNGLIDTEFPNYTDEVYIEKLREEKHGATTYLWHGNKLPEYADGTIDDHWVTFDWALSVHTGQPTGASYNTVVRHLMVIPTQTSAEKTERILYLMNWVLSDEGKQWVHMGIPGQEWVESGDTYDVFAPKDLMSNLFLFFTFGGGTLTDLDVKYLVPGFGKNAVDRLVRVSSVGQYDKLGAYLPYYEELATFGLDRIKDEYELKAILGNVDIEATWDQYVADYLRAGGQEVIDFWTNWYFNEGGKELIDSY